MEATACGHGALWHPPERTWGLVPGWLIQTLLRGSANRGPRQLSVPLPSWSLGWAALLAAACTPGGVFPSQCPRLCSGGRLPAAEPPLTSGGGQVLPGLWPFQGPSSPPGQCRSFYSSPAPPLSPRSPLRPWRPCPLQREPEGATGPGSGLPSSEQGGSGARGP